MSVPSTLPDRKSFRKAMRNLADQIQEAYQVVGGSYVFPSATYSYDDAKQTVSSTNPTSQPQPVERPTRVKRTKATPTVEVNTEDIVDQLHKLLEERGYKEYQKPDRLPGGPIGQKLGPPFYCWTLSGLLKDISAAKPQGDQTPMEMVLDQAIAKARLTKKFHEPITYSFFVNDLFGLLLK